MMLTTAEAADRLSITARSVARLIKRGTIKAEKRGRDYLIEVAEVERYKSERIPAHRPKKVRKISDTRANTSAVFQPPDQDAEK
jgi:excisionase family DNA binding protein